MATAFVVIEGGVAGDVIEPPGFHVEIVDLDVLQGPNGPPDAEYVEWLLEALHGYDLGFDLDSQAGIEAAAAWIVDSVHAVTYTEEGEAK